MALRQWILVGVAAGLLLMAQPSMADVWRGTAPFCEGECLTGERQLQVSDWGDGGYCVTGHKVLCSNASPTCPITQTNAECYGVVKICENGSPDQTGHFRACTSYACGMCFGIGTVSSALSVAPRCKQGYVWREAVDDDYVCVTPRIRSQSAADNAQARNRIVPGGGAYGPATCKAGYVWREAIPLDLVCVTPQTRQQVQQDNAAAASRWVATPTPASRDTCKTGFVWREAIPNDRVCVTPSRRREASADNAAAASRRSPNGGAAGPDTCKAGFVWREVVPTDHVCVTPAVRAQAAEDNRAARARRVGS